MLATCSADDKSFKVSSLKDSEYLEYEHEWNSSTKRTTLFIFKVDNGKRELIKEMAGLLSRRVFITNNKKDCFFLIEDIDRTISLGSLWYLNGNKGTGEVILKTVPVFAVSDNSEYLCYRDNKYIREENGARLSIPVVHIYSVWDKKIIETLDYHDKELKDLYGVGANIEYEKSTNSFIIKFNIENYNIISGRFFLDIMGFTRDPDDEENPFAIKN